MDKLDHIFELQKGFQDKLVLLDVSGSNPFVLKSHF